MSTAQTAAQAALAAILAKRKAAQVPATEATAKPALPAPQSVQQGGGTAPVAGAVVPAPQPLPSKVRIPPIDATSETVLARMEMIEKALLSNDPNMRTYLAHMHQQLLKYPELIYVLQPDQVGVLVKTATRVAGVELTTSEKARKERSERSQLKSMSVDDL